MFENLMRELKSMERMKMSFPIVADEDGYIDKECPNEDCLFQFKVYEDDWKNVFKDEAVYCPKCGKNAISNKWYTAEQVNAGKQMAINNVKARIGIAMRQDAQQFNRNSKKGFLTFSMEVNGFNEHRINLPIQCKEIFEQKIVCEKCKARYAVIGSAFYCPSCGHNSSRHMFKEFIDTTNAKISNLDFIKKQLSSVNKDDTERIIRTLIETIPNDLVTSIQCLSEDVYSNLPNSKPIRKNTFQRIDDSILLWEEAINESHNTWLTAEELAKLRKYYQQRHLLAHNNGIVDEEYIKKSNDKNYEVGQRIIIVKQDVVEFCEIIKKLGNEILRFA
ncbi:MAG: hypothetical protein J6A89_03855 [Clostridia bacterium]|nr:hypothetical protein [Clostridia bacterium]